MLYAPDRARIKVADFKRPQIGRGETRQMLYGPRSGADKAFCANHSNAYVEGASIVCMGKPCDCNARMTGASALQCPHDSDVSTTTCFSSLPPARRRRLLSSPLSSCLSSPSWLRLLPPFCRAPSDSNRIFCCFCMSGNTMTNAMRATANVPVKPHAMETISLVWSGTCFRFRTVRVTASTTMATSANVPANPPMMVAVSLLAMLLAARRLYSLSHNSRRRTNATNKKSRRTKSLCKPND